MRQIFLQLLALFILLGIGAIARKRNIITADGIKSLSRIVIDVTMPAWVFAAIYKECSPGLLKMSYYLPLIGVMNVGVGYLMGLFASRITGFKDEKKGTLTYLFMINNYGFLPLPLVYGLYGDRGVLFLFLQNLGSNIFFWSFAIRVLNKKAAESPLKSVFNVGMIAMAAGIVISIIGVKMPGFIIDSVDLLGKSTIPLAMLTVGAVLVGIDFRSEFKKLYVPVLVAGRLIVYPLIIIGICSLFDFPKIVRDVVIITATMPSSSTTPVFTERYGGDTVLAGSGVFFTTIFSIVTIPVFLNVFI